MCGAMEVRRVLVVYIFSLLKLLGRLRTLKPFGPFVAPLITSNHLRGE